MKKADLSSDEMRAEYDFSKGVRPEPHSTLCAREVQTNAVLGAAYPHKCATCAIGKAVLEGRVRRLNQAHQEIAEGNSRRGANPCRRITGGEW